MQYNNVMNGIERDTRYFLERYRDVVKSSVAAFALLATSNLVHADATIKSLDDVNTLLDIQNKQLQIIQRKAQDVLFFGSDDYPKDKTNHCKQLWKFLETHDRFDIPQPIMIARTETEKENLFNSLYSSGESNFNRYMSQVKKPTSKAYKTVRAKSRYDSKELPKKFEESWASNPFSVIGAKGLFDEKLTIHLLYFLPTSFVGYQHPVVVSLFKDQCEGCTSLSIGLRSVFIDGLLYPEFGNGEMFTQSAYPDALAQAELHSQTKLIPSAPYLLIGMGVFNRQLIIWHVQEKTWEEPKNENNALFYYKSGDAGKYFRRYVFSFSVLTNPSSSAHYGSGDACSVRFN